MKNLLPAAWNKRIRCKKISLMQNLMRRDAESPKINQASATRRMGSNGDSEQAMVSSLIRALTSAAATG